MSRAPDMDQAELARQIEALPDKPGVYVFRDAGGQVLYVGKARSLRSRVRSYFQASRQTGPRQEAMVGQVSDLEYIVTATPGQALIVESSYVKKHRPRYNVRLRDDKQYPYVRVGLGEEYPSVTLARTRETDGARYFGPYTQSHALRDTLQALRSVFPHRSCRRIVARERPCLNHFIGRCLAPCLGTVTKAQYREMIDGLLLLMSGRDDHLRIRLEERMLQAAEDLRFEQAARYRDQLRSLEAVVEGQEVVTTSLRDRDVVGLAADPAHACAQVFFFRRGRLVGRDSYFLQGAVPGDEGEALSAFLTQYYAVAAEVPGEILLSLPSEDQSLLEEWLSELRGRRVQLRVPQRGEGRRLVDLARENAALALRDRRHRRELSPERLRQDLVELQAALNLEDYPHRIECYDISNLSGQDAVGSMVVLEGGQPKKADYRRFRLRTPGPDDYAMLAETVRRRLQRRQVSSEADSFAVLPDLVIVDGGKGQARAAAEVLAQEDLVDIPVFGLAKEAEVLHGPGDEAPVTLPAGSGALFVLMRLRDEAHRFALAYHRRLRAKRLVQSELDHIPGVGPKRRTLLLRHFGSGRKVREAGLEQLLAVPGMPRPLAQRIYNHFRSRAAASPPTGQQPRGEPPHGNQR